MHGDSCTIIKGYGARSILGSEGPIQPAHCTEVKIEIQKGKTARFRRKSTVRGVVWPRLKFYSPNWDFRQIDRLTAESVS